VQAGASPASARDVRLERGETEYPRTIGSDLHARSPLLLVGRLGNQPVALPAATVEHVLRMVALTPLPDAPPDVVGVVSVHGTVLPVVDPRPRLGLATPRAHPDQYLVVVCAASRYLLWLDGVDRVTAAAPDTLESVAGGNDRALAPFVLHLEGNLLPVLSPQALDPGPIVGPSQAASRPKALAYARDVG
jgi:purine-binding chemotaxis protein CheW